MRLAPLGSGLAPSGATGSLSSDPTAHGKRPDPTRTGHLEHHRKANEAVDVWGEMRENAGRFAKALLVTNVVLAPFIGIKRSVPLSLGLTAGFIAVNFYHARTHLRAPSA